MSNCKLCDKVTKLKGSVVCSHCWLHFHVACLAINENRSKQLYSDRCNTWICCECINVALPFSNVTSTDFANILIMENSHSCLDYDIDTNELQCLNLCENLDDIGPFNSEIDPDQNLLTDSKLKCAYYTFQSFDAYLLKELAKETSNLTLLCVNIRSAPRNLEKLDMLIDQCIFKPRVIGITETWLNESNQDLYHLNNYKSVNSVRTNKKGGGVSLMVKFGITYESIPSMTLSKKHIECVFIKVEKFSICSYHLNL